MAEYLALHKQLPRAGKTSLPHRLVNTPNTSIRTGFCIKARLSEIFFALKFHPDLKSGAELLLKMFLHSTPDLRLNRDTT
jgi:hypothetical protein